ncbi:cystine/glutamate transporter-like [Lytechinus variegatus]|uniref:cystine/glutamate transporter-like n=1 Tax=Lytechinus variegatus TaxID=7654 RepID=UPI001BB2880A|nr:cystine/glutamate transporter-like [Lytechinus variegatus]XP_041457245.1 cystine/glutamate transporter-like [Lytechinus variegatus]
MGDPDKDVDQIPAAERPGGEKVVLKRTLGLASCISFIIGIVIGTGIFVSPKGVLRGVNGSVGWAMILWTLCGLISMTGALCYVELITSYTKSGGEFTFLLDAFGPVVAFLRMWTLLFLIGPSANAVQSLTVANYLTVPFFGCDEVPPPQSAVVLIAICVLFLIFFVNCISVKWTARLQVFFTVAKVFGLIILIITGLVFIFKGHVSNLQNAFEDTDISIKGVPLAIYSGIFAYAGWDYISSMTEEVKKPEKTIPISVMISMSTVIVIYLLANIGYFSLLTPQEVLSSDAVGADFGVRALGNWSWLIWLFVALSAAGNLNGAVFGRTRTFFVAAREGLLPEFLSMIHINHLTPIPAIAISLPFSIMFILVGDALVLIEYLTFIDWFFSALTIAIIPYYRWKYKDMRRPFKIPLPFAIIFIIFTLFIMVMTFYAKPIHSLVGVLATLAGIPVYYLCVWWNNKPQWMINATLKVNLLFQKFFFAIRQEEKTY